LHLGADALAQRVLSGGEMPVGVVTALLGSPFLLVLLRRSA
ncbi:MAG: iron chelate uptake ABC transporter family permease subunit, partial [Fimbriimonas ginsengisoli]|nr:iron chelate uptake ABC transporter family permease subunit [Fimbriimonas ginsengisoli]